MLINKAEVLKSLKMIAGFDPTASPYVAVQFPPDGAAPAFYRSSNYGFIKSKSIDDAGELTYVSLSHLQDCLKNLPDDQIDMAVEKNGGLKVSSVDAMFDNYLRVHTVHLSQAGLKRHSIGEVVTRLSPQVFSAFDVKPFHAEAAPSLIKGILTLGTLHGVVMWHGATMALNAVNLSPRESFLRMVCGSEDIEEVVITDHNYWGVSIAGLTTYISGHTMGRQLFDSYDVAGEELAKLPAERLVFALKAAANLCGDTQKVLVDPKRGIESRDRFGNEAVFSLGVGGWNKFYIFAKTAKAIIDVISQTNEEEAVLYNVPQPHPTMRLKRGNFEINFRIL
jgi:hypothetical protein